MLSIRFSSGCPKKLTVVLVVSWLNLAPSRLNCCLGRKIPVNNLAQIRFITCGALFTGCHFIGLLLAQAKLTF